jgi:hypothetical protein
VSVLPDVTGMSNTAAAETYAKTGFCVVPIRLGTKNPGSLVGAGWPTLATDDLETVRDWWRRWPDAGIAIHVGGCLLLVVDVDIPENVPDWLWALLESAVFRPTTTDPNSRRGHYFYRLRPDEMFGCGLGRLKPPKGKKWGETKCYGGGLVLAPTAHPKTADGHVYSTGPNETIPYRPDELATKLNAAPNDGEWRILTPSELDAKAQAFLGTYAGDAEPYALDPICRNFDPTPSNRHPSMYESLCWAMREAKAGRFSAQRAVDGLRKLWTDSIGGEYRDDDPDEFNRLLRDAIARADADGTADELRARAGGFTSVEAWRGAQNGFDNWAVQMVDAPATDSRFRLVSARELAEPVAPTRWLVRGIWPERSAGVLAGNKKSLKTWNLQAIALAVAAGTALFDEYPAVSPGGVLYLCGEGGRDTFANRHQVIAARYGIDDRALRELKLGVDFGVGTLTDADFIDAVKRHLDTLQPKLVILDPLYAYHPSDVEVQNVYARGPMLANLRELVGSEAALIVGDHFNKTAGKNLDLDNIAQAGMAQWADSWILQKHREVPDLENGKYQLELETGTRRGGGKHLEVDWMLERDQGDPDAVSWSNADWDARPFVPQNAESRATKTAERIMQVVADNPFELTESGVAEKVGGKREKAFEVLNQLKVNGWLVVENRERKEGTRMVNRNRVGVGEAAKRLRGAGTGSEVVPDEGTGSERVDP